MIIKTTLIALLCPFFMLQNNPNVIFLIKKEINRERKKIAFITKELDLSSQEAQLF